MQIAPLRIPMLDFAPWAISSVAERFLHTEEATGSIPVSPTILSNLLNISPSDTLSFGSCSNPSFSGQNEKRRLNFTSVRRGTDSELCQLSEVIMKIKLFAV